jgi:hypothetical protein
MRKLEERGALRSNGTMKIGASVFSPRETSQLLRDGGEWRSTAALRSPHARWQKFKTGAERLGIAIDRNPRTQKEALAIAPKARRAPSKRSKKTPGYVVAAKGGWQARRD